MEAAPSPYWPTHSVDWHLGEIWSKSCSDLPKTYREKMGFEWCLTHSNSSYFLMPLCQQLWGLIYIYIYVIWTTIMWICQSRMWIWMIWVPPNFIFEVHDPWNGIHNKLDQLVSWFCMDINIDRCPSAQVTTAFNLKTLNISSPTNIENRLCLLWKYMTYLKLSEYVW
jgi:hypothetical protein